MHYKTRVKSDRYDKHMEHQREMLGELGIGMDGDDTIPVDLYGKRIPVKKTDPENVKNAGKDIQEFYDLESQGLKEGGE